MPHVIEIETLRLSVMERIGMRNAQQDFEHPAITEGHPLRLHCLYRITSSQWSRNAA